MDVFIKFSWKKLEKNPISQVFELYKKLKTKSRFGFLGENPIFLYIWFKDWVKISGLMDVFIKFSWKKLEKNQISQLFWIFYTKSLKPSPDSDSLGKIQSFCVYGLKIGSKL